MATIQEEDGEEEQEEEDPDKDGEQEAGQEARDYAKARKFARLLQSGRLPDDVKKMYVEAGKKKSTSRLFRTKLINALFQKSSTGEWALATDTPDTSLSILPGEPRHEVWQLRSRRRSCICDALADISGKSGSNDRC